MTMKHWNVELQLRETFCSKTLKPQVRQKYFAMHHLKERLKVVNGTMWRCTSMERKFQILTISGSDSEKEEHLSLPKYCPLDTPKFKIKFPSMVASFPIFMEKQEQ